jgi:hypothetical protein
MPYSAEISRNNPACFVFLVDQSGSMADVVGNTSESRRKCDEVADVINRLLSNLVIRCAKEEGIRDYFHVGIIGYGASVGSAFGGLLAGRDVVPISEIGNTPTRVDERTKKSPDGAGGLVDETVKFPNLGRPGCQWWHPDERSARHGGTEHLRVARGPPRFLPSGRAARDRRESTDGDPTLKASELRALSSSDGDVLLFNLNVSSDPSAPIVFPDTDLELPNQYAKLLFSMSSHLPGHMQAYAREQGMEVPEAARGFVFNSDVTSLVQFFDIGTRTTNLR